MKYSQFFFRILLNTTLVQWILSLPTVQEWHLFKETSLLYVCGLELYVVASFKPEQLKRKKIFNIHTYSKFLDKLICQNG